MLFAIVEVGHRLDQHLVTLGAFLLLGDAFVLQRIGVLQPILPLAIAILAHRNVERGIAAHRHATVHRHHVIFRHAQIGRDLSHVLGAQIAILERLDIVLHPAQVEEQLLLRRGGAHLDQAPAAQDEFLDRRADPPHGVGRQAEATFGLELLHALHQADIAFADQFADRQAIAAIAHGDLRHEAQVGGDELGRRLGILMFLVALREHIFLLGGQQRKLANFRQIAVEAGFTAQRRNRGDIAPIGHVTIPSLYMRARQTRKWHPLAAQTCQNLYVKLA